MRQFEILFKLTYSRQYFRVLLFLLVKAEKKPGTADKRHE